VRVHLRGVALEQSWGIGQGSFDQEPIARGLDIPLCYDLVKSPRSLRGLTIQVYEGDDGLSLIFR
jgi:hypothetical protein